MYLTHAQWLSTVTVCVANYRICGLYIVILNMMYMVNSCIRFFKLVIFPLSAYFQLEDDSYS